MLENIDLGKTVTPDIIAKYAILTSYRKYDGGVDHEFFEAVGEEFGLKVKSYFLLPEWEESTQ